MIKKCEGLYVVLTLLALGGGLIPSQAEQGLQIEDNPGRYILVKSLVFLFLLPLGYVYRHKLWHRLKRVKGVLVICCFCVLSTVWSLDSKFTLRRSIILCLTSLFAIYFAECFDWDEQMKLFTRFIVVELIACAFLIALLPEYSISTTLHHGAWRGFFSHKNLLGRFCGMSVVFLLTADLVKLRLLFKVALLVLAALELTMAQSATSVGVTLIVLLMSPALHVLRVRSRGPVPLWACLLPLLLLPFAAFVFYPELILDVLGKESTLTGRLPLWNSVLHQLSYRPWLGFGFSAFWFTLNPYVAAVRTEQGWLVPHAHDGFIDVAVDLGLIGLLALLIGLIQPVLQSVKFYRASDSRGAAMPLLLMTYIFLFNFTESDLILIPAFFWLILVWIVASLDRMSEIASVSPAATYAQATPPAWRIKAAKSSVSADAQAG